MSGRETKTLRLEDEVDQYLDDKKEEWGASRSDIVNRAIKVYAAKMARGEWMDPKFKDKIDEEVEEM